MCASRSVLHSLARTFTQREREREKRPRSEVSSARSLSSLCLCVSLSVRVSLSRDTSAFKKRSKNDARLCGPPLKSLLLLVCVFEKRFFLETHKHWSLFSSYLCFFGAHKSIISSLGECARGVHHSIFISLRSALHSLRASCSDEKSAKKAEV